MLHLGQVRHITRYPVKSMAGVPTDSAFLGWHGLDGDRRFAFRRLDDPSGFPWLTASRLPQLLRYQPLCPEQPSAEPLPTQVRTPAGACLPLRSPELAAALAAACGSPVELMHLRHGIFDDAPLSLLTLATIAAIGRAAALDLDPRRFRANLLLETQRAEPFLEDAWLGGLLLFGDTPPQPAVSVTLCDRRCVMLNLDPDTAQPDPRVLKTVVDLNHNNAGVYATVVRTGTLRVGDPVTLVPQTAPLNTPTPAAQRP